jgi:hypothetical protein
LRLWRKKRRKKSAILAFAAFIRHGFLRHCHKKRNFREGRGGGLNAV